MEAEKAKDPTPKPTKEQINEVINPSLSGDRLKFGGKEIVIQILPIDAEEKFALLLEPVVKEILGNLPEKVNLKEIMGRVDASLIKKYADVLREMMVVIAQNSDPEIDKAFIGKSLHTFGIIKAIMLQVEKNELASMVTSFFFKAATMLPQIKGEENPPSPQS